MCEERGPCEGVMRGGGGSERVKWWGGEAW